MIVATLMVPRVKKCDLKSRKIGLLPYEKNMPAWTLILTMECAVTVRASSTIHLLLIFIKLFEYAVAFNKHLFSTAVQYLQIIFSTAVQYFQIIFSAAVQYLRIITSKIFFKNRTKNASKTLMLSS